MFAPRSVALTARFGCDVPIPVCDQVIRSFPSPFKALRVLDVRTCRPHR